MITPEDLRKEFESLFKLKNAHQRGKGFEKTLSRYLFEAGLEIHPDAKSAAPRQTDLFARQGNQDYLIEAKWLSSKIDVSHIDDLRSRLSRTPSDIVGCIFSMSDYTETAIREVEQHRTREILLFNPLEVNSLFTGHEDLLRLIDQKRSSLRVAAKVWFYEGEEAKQSVVESLLPPAEETIHCGNRTLTSIASQGTFSDAVFARRVPDIRWGLTRTQGVGMVVPLRIQFVWELRDIMGLLHNQLHLSSQGSFNISQNQVTWHGIGVREFLTEVERWEKRYEESSLRTPHHSEDIAYFDEIESGFLFVSARQRVGTTSFLHDAELEIRLPGVPVDLTPFLKICSETQNRGAFFCPLEEAGYDEIRFKDRVYLKPVAWIHSIHPQHDEQVSGIVARNPYFASKRRLPKGRLEYSPFDLIGRCELLLCRLGDWHSPGDIVDRYYLTRIEGTWTASKPVIMPVCTWENVIREGD